MKKFFERLRFYLIKMNPKYKDFRCEKLCLNCKFYDYCKNDFLEFINYGK